MMNLRGIKIDTKFIQTFFKCLSNKGSRAWFY